MAELDFSKYEDLQACIEESRISITKDYIKSPEVLMVGDSTFGTLGNFSVSIGKAKSKKTFNVSAIVAAALSNGSVLHYNAKFPEDKRFVLYIDTEQGQLHCQKVLNRIIRLMGHSLDSDPENLLKLALRRYSPEERITIIEQAIEAIPNLGLVIIDGVRDLLYDINSANQATEISTKLMRWTYDKQIHLHTILHQNKSDENARGHIGTELNNKAESVLQIEVDKEDKSISVVESLLSRGKDFEPFAFCINDEILPELVEDYTPTKKKAGRPTKAPFDPYKDITEDVHRKALTVAFENGSIGKYNDFVKALRRGYQSQGVKLGQNRAVAVAQFVCNKRMVVKDNKVYEFK